MLSAALTLGSRLTFVGGKGGVGKTTVAAALGVELASMESPVLVISTDPAHSLGDALRSAIGGDARTIEEVEGLQALEVDADRERLRFFEANGAAIRALIERGTYLDDQDARQLTEQVLPGLDELAALFSVMRLSREFAGRLIVDTAPTGHTLRLLELPTVALGWLGALDAMEAKHAAVASAMGGSYPDDAATHFLTELRTDIDSLASLLRDASATRFVLVTTAEPVVMAETRRFRDRLERLGIAPGGVVVNRQTRAPPETARGGGMVYVPELDFDPSGPEGLRRFSRSASEDPDFTTGGHPEESLAVVEVGGRFFPPLDRHLYWVGGKGGVGKTTAAAALAVGMADRGRRVLLLGLDPAGSLDEVLGIQIRSEPTPVPDVPGLTVQQIDADRSWSAFRTRYRDEVDQLFDELLSGSLSAPLDRDVIERLVDLAPPGLDELMALTEVIDVTEDRTYDALVLDTAPTGHLLRLLEMPDVALEWTHTVLRLLLKYREAISLGGLGERVLHLSRSLRALREDLRDERNTYFLAIALPESLGIPEMSRLLARLQKLEMRADTLLVNRTLDEHGAMRALARDLTMQLSRIDPAVELASAPLLDAPPRAPGALRAFCESWRQIHVQSGPEAGEE